MPTGARFDGLRAVIYPNDHRPAHVHVIGRGCEAVFDLRCPCGPPALRENYGFGKAEITRVKATALDGGLVIQPAFPGAQDDWFSMLGHGRRVTATGTSESAEGCDVFGISREVGVVEREHVNMRQQFADPFER